MSRAAALARSTFALSEFLTSVFSGSRIYATPPKPRPPSCYWSLARPKDESRSSDIGNVPVLEAPSIPTLYRRFQITAALSDTAVWVYFLASFYVLRHRFLLLTHRLDLFLLVLVLSLFRLALWCSFARHVAVCLDRQTR
jgi:hypothetical protein